MKKEAIVALKKLLSSPKNIVIVSHKNPDGDAIGSSLALSLYLKAKQHRVSVIMPNDFPEFLKWMPESEAVLIYDYKAKECNEKIAAADLIFTLDFNALSRVDNMQAALEGSKADFVMIDHHQEPDDYAHFTYSDTSICATAQMVYHFIEMMEDIHLLNKNIAENLYTGIMTDTGSFRFRSTTSTTHRVVAQLIDLGVDNAKVHQNVFDANSAQRMQLLGVALQNLNILPEYKTAYITLSQEELDAHNHKKGDTEGFVNYALSVKDVVFAVIFIEHKEEGIVKMSLRSTGNFSVNEFAKKHFNGGGHKNASGGRSELPLDETVSHFIRILQDYKTQLTDAE
jgi:phosphoesterase RecJ-like protein